MKQVEIIIDRDTDEINVWTDGYHLYKGTLTNESQQHYKGESTYKFVIEEDIDET